MDAITSRENKWLKLFRAALRGSGPKSGEPIGVEGPKLIEDALRSGLEAEALLISESAERDAEAILRAASDTEGGVARSRILRTTDKLFRSVAGTDAPQGVAALFRQRSWGLEDVLRGVGEIRGVSPLASVLAGVQDPGNVGTILRSAEAFGATGAVSTRGTADPWSPKALRASAGAGLRLPVLRGMAIAVLLAQLRIAGVKIYAAGAAAADAASQVDVSDEEELRGPAAIFVGNEGAGLPAEVKRAADATLAIAMRPIVESLNAAVAASIVLYEAAKQRQSELRISV
ncbi:MAG: RNA methyltransferase [Acidobacteriota bacterium]|nr:RNA methyltransferase [Acidobacteriota bacterium]